MPDNRVSDSPAALVAIARAAREAGDRDLCRVAVKQLRDEFGITLQFTRRHDVALSNDQKPAEAH
jgi:hypothetical protein